MLRSLLVALCMLMIVGSLKAQSKAQQRAASMKKGINLSWLDRRWLGTEAAKHRDYINLQDLPHYKAQLALIAKMGYGLVRFPVCFDLWYSPEPPYQLLTPEYFAAIDSVLHWTERLGLQLIIDNHHGILNASNYKSEAQRISFIWKQVATRYQHANAEQVFFELYNEPAQISAEDWQLVADSLVAAVRTVTQVHTLIVGANAWNGRDALLRMPAVPDSNVIYTFHFYDPFLFTHQGAEWVGAPAATTFLPYPYQEHSMPPIAAEAAATWADGAYQRYATDATYDDLYVKLKEVQAWSIRNRRPIFCGEWGAYKAHAHEPDRCAYLKDVYAILTELRIPNAMWEWDAGFSMFVGDPDPEDVSPCLREALKVTTE